MKRLLTIFLIFAMLSGVFCVYAEPEGMGQDITSTDNDSDNTAVDEENDPDGGDQDTDNSDNSDNDSNNPNDNNDNSDDTPVFDWTADLTKPGDSFLNIQTYSVEEGEKEMMYNAETVLRRDNAAGEAWIIYEIPYITEMSAVSYHLASDVACFSFELSKDGEEWTAAEVEAEETTAPDRWTKVEYSLTDIENIRYVKVIWGEEQNTANWWNPYFGGLFANVGEAVPTELVILTEGTLQIPMYDSVTYTIEAEIRDQIGIKYDGELVWEILSSESGEDIEITESGTFTVVADMPDGYEFTVRVSAIEETLSAQKTFTLAAPMPGDTDGDNIITDIDITKICENYGRELTVDNRLCDANKDGMIDIIDLAYAAKYIKEEQEVE